LRLSSIIWESFWAGAGFEAEAADVVADTAGLSEFIQFSEAGEVVEIFYSLLDGACGAYCEAGSTIVTRAVYGVI